MKVVNYKVICSNLLMSLNDKVEDLLAEGWQPFGPPFIDSRDCFIHQAMVLYDEDSV